MSKKAYDLAVIGGGSAGLTAATIAGKMGANTLLVDKERLGGDCLYNGCVPSKALIKCSRLAHDMKRAGLFGIESHGLEPDIRAVLERVWSVVENLAEHDSPKALARFGVETRFGGAQFLSPHSIRVAGDEIEADRFLIAAGSHAQAPPIEGLDEAGFIDHVSLFHLEKLPNRLAVIGGGPIGVEMGQALARLGSRVTILESGPRLLGRADPELADQLGNILAGELEVRTNVTVTKIESLDRAKRIHFAEQEGQDFVDADEILVAVGRRPSLQDLALKRCGVDVTERGIVVDAHMRTTNPRIWAAGDCTGGPQFTHVAEAQARVAARNALFRGKQKFSNQGLPWTIFSDPELSHVGLTEQQASDSGRPYKVYRYPYAKLDRAVTEGRDEGLAKVVVDGKGYILGASLLGPESGEAISEFVLAMREGITLKRLASTIHVYPTMNRIVRRLADQPFLQQERPGAMVRFFARFSSKTTVKRPEG